MKEINIAIIGSGALGTSVAGLLAGNNPEKTINIYTDEKVVEGQINRSNCNEIYLPGVKLSPKIRASMEIRKVISGAEFIIIAAQPHVFKSVMKDISSQVPSGCIFVIMSKGFVSESGRTLSYSSYLREKYHVPADRICVVHGPTISLEFSGKFHTVLVAASSSSECADKCAGLFENEWISLRIESDVTGVEVAAAFKYPLAVAMGLISRLPGSGDNLSGVLFSMGFSEIIDVAKAAGAEEKTVLGVSGLGDIAATSFGEKSSARQFGKKLFNSFSPKGGKVGLFKKIFSLFFGKKITKLKAREISFAADALRLASLYASERKVETPLLSCVLDILEGRADCGDLLSFVKSGSRSPRSGIISRALEKIGAGWRGFLKIRLRVKKLFSWFKGDDETDDI